MLFIALSKGNENFLTKKTSNVMNHTKPEKKLERKIVDGMNSSQCQSSERATFFVKGRK